MGDRLGILGAVDFSFFIPQNKKLRFSASSAFNKMNLQELPLVRLELTAFRLLAYVVL